MGCACLVVPDIARWVGIEKPALVAFWDLQEPCQHAGAGNMIVGLDAINRGDGLVCRAGNLYRRPPCPFRWTRQTATGEMHFGAGWRTVGLSYGSDDAAETEEARRCLWHRALGKELADLDELVCDSRMRRRASEVRPEGPGATPLRARQRLPVRMALGIRTGCFTNPQ